ncbi:hypothetical protein [Sphaerisporangium fuscum]|uniref:hypothetical protein n=1 Tax=Sphaerisporangium fuscum TaxID=2835868 RepID=UPI001BDCDEF2|nr:hypothetical protein [Sphaerisporangium fuscum]
MRTEPPPLPLPPPAGVRATPADVREIVLPRPHYASIVAHAVRKLTGHYIDGEVSERKAFGLLLGRQRGYTLHVSGVLPLLANMRQDPNVSEDMDELVDHHAIPSETPNDQRGWVAHPRELMDAEDFCDEHDVLVVGNYHTHRVPWPDDPLRDSCTRLDRMLAAESGQWVFIVSAVDLHRPSIRAFYEGRNECEATVLLRPVRAHAPAVLQKGSR